MGHLPTKLRGQDVWLEFDNWNPDELLRESPEIETDRNWKYLLAFRWDSNPYSGVAAYLTAAAYAKATEGAIFDCEEGKFISWQRAAEIANELEEYASTLEAELREIRSGLK